MTYLLLEQDDKRKRTYVYHFVENGAKQTHLEYLRHKYPNYNKDDDTAKDIGRARFFHQSVDVV